MKLCALYTLTSILVTVCALAVVSAMEEYGGRISPPDPEADYGAEWGSVPNTGSQHPSIFSDLPESPLGQVSKDLDLAEQRAKLLFQKELARRHQISEFARDVRRLLSGIRRRKMHSRTSQNSKRQSTVKVNKRHCWDVADVCCMWNIC